MNINNFKEITVDPRDIFEQARHFHSLTPEQQSLASMHRMIDEIGAMQRGEMGIVQNPLELMDAASAGIEAAQAARAGGHRSNTSSGRPKYWGFPKNPLGR